MAKRMLIDATHPEEVRVVVHNENKLEDFDFETLSKKQLKGNIYLARVTRVEPSLQAAFVEYGGNRHGFLPFSEIHPDYYRVPVADRDNLLEGEIVNEAEVEDKTNTASAEEDISSGSSDDPESVAKQQDDTIEEIAGETSVDSINDDDSDFEEKTKSRVNLMKRYKIQEVIKRRQVILVQVAKEERGNKGAALTTYLSLAGRYSVLMPNTNKGGGISRKISSPNDRKRLKDILSELKIPEGIAVIVRTAGSQRTKMEIRRDYEYLIRLWNEIRENTLQSDAPSLIYEEANLIKRAMRDLYTSDMEEILVEGERGYKMAKSCMRSLMPSHAKKVKNYKGMQVPLYHRFQVETQIDAMHNPIVQLKSGGYIVINPTEALVAVDVNSGRATKERHIEETAFKTNQEAADEVARQVRLRDLAGLLVIDFIDMDDPKHNREVERRLKDAMQADRARIQLGRISPFGLLEMSRQRLRPSIVENSTVTCPHCDGIGTMRTTESTALHVLRALEEDGIRRGGGKIELFVPTEVALYILNQKRTRLIEIEQRYKFSVDINADNTIVIPNFRLERLVSNNDGPIEEIMPLEPVKPASVKSTRGLNDDRSDRSDSDERTDGDQKRRRRRRRRKDRPEVQESETESNLESQQGAEQIGDQTKADGDQNDDDFDDDDRPRKRRRRGKRGGRRRTRRPDSELAENETAEVSGSEADQSSDRPQTEDTSSPFTDAASEASGDQATSEAQPVGTVTETVEEKPKKRRAPRRRKVVTEDVTEAPTVAQPEAAQATEAQADVQAVEAEATTPSETTEEEKPAKPKRAPRKRAATGTRRPRKKAAAETDTTDAPSAETVAVEPTDAKAVEADKEEKPKPRTRTRAKTAAKPRSTATRTRKPRATKAAEKAEATSGEAAVAVKAPSSKKPAPAESKPVVAAAPAAPAPTVTAAAPSTPAPAKPEPAKPDASGPKKKGWWSRITGH
ncbi:Rne/Rng family ribonuclease [Kiloniella sp.]|uniref:Rne/Rng family ribonuclease n=1 Tax=Kiloniella sp. TaxID=1938587 RepID=UPI003B02097B